MRYIISIEIEDKAEAAYLYDELEIILSDLDSTAMLSMTSEEDAQSANMA